MTLAGLPFCLLIPWVSDRSTNRRGLYLVVCAAWLAAAIVALQMLPSYAVFSAVIAGIALGALFPLTLTLPLDVASRPREVAGYAAMMLAGGYAVAALGPALLGMSRDLTGSFATCFWILAAAAAALAVLSLTLYPGRPARRPAPR
jgi:CP family cyanate transporter-like MFS transporter